MSNPYYNYTSNLPADHTKGTAATVRSELSSIGAGFDAVDTAIDAVFAGGGLSSASSTSLTVGTGSKSLTVATDLSFAAGQYVIIADTAAPTTNYMEGRITSYSSTTGAMVVSVSTSAGGGTIASWTVSLQGQLTTPTITRRAITGTDTVGVSDIAKLIDITSGTFTLAFTACATLGNGAWGYIRNSGTGDVTLDPDGSEQIDGLTSFVMYPGAVRLWQCDGSAIRTVALSGGTKTFASTANYIWAPGVQAWDYDAIGAGAGGGGGARAATRYNGGGAGAGERRRGRVAKSQVTVGGSTTCTVGAKGTGGAAATGDNLPAAAWVTTGTAGGDTSIGALAVVNGGVVSNNGASSSAHGNGSRGGGTGSIYVTGVGGGYIAPGQSYMPGVAPTQSGGDTEWAGPTGRAGDDVTATGKVATLGGQRGGRGGASFAAGTAGGNGSNPGDGGDGGAGNINGSAAGKGGDGADGQITITEVI